ncbi:uncharacterized protein BJX67DRAFT_386669 [Aspergillus lucknowensis]|uniref:Uncharacterized protein n=1 Tax=Aspergillus lucknowensis TaxID=176173 RepID=A0ABR4L5L0_9EURO
MDVDDVDQGLGSDPPDFAQTREKNFPVDDSDKNSTPGNYADIDPVDLTKDDDEAEEWGLDGGTTLAINKASRGLIYPNSYCVVTVWESAQAERTIKKILNVAWMPKRKIRSIEDLLANPTATCVDDALKVNGANACSHLIPTPPPSTKATSVTR